MYINKKKLNDLPQFNSEKYNLDFVRKTHFIKRYF